MKVKHIRWIPIAAFTGMALFFVTAMTGMNRPGSIFCCYKIYKQPDGTYEVWWRGRISWLEKGGLTYEQAKALQLEKCKTFWDFAHPTGERVK